MIRTIGFVRSIPKFVALQAIAGYRLFVSPYLVSSCCFVPSCSEYSRQALDKYGALKGGWLTWHAWRVATYLASRATTH